MSIALRIIMAAILSFQFAMANSMEGKKDFIAAEKAALAKLANRSDLTVKDWLQFVDEIDNKCDTEKSKPKQDAMCTFFYSFFLAGQLFSDAPNQTPTWEDCMRAGMTTDSLSVNENVNKLVNRILVKLCPKE